MQIIRDLINDPKGADADAVKAAITDCDDLDLLQEAQAAVKKAGLSLLDVKIQRRIQQLSVADCQCGKRDVPLQGGRLANHVPPGKTFEDPPCRYSRETPVVAGAVITSGPVAVIQESFVDLDEDDSDTIGDGTEDADFPVKDLDADDEDTAGACDDEGAQPGCEDHDDPTCPECVEAGLFNHKDDDCDDTGDDGGAEAKADPLSDRQRWLLPRLLGPSSVSSVALAHIGFPQWDDTGEAVEDDALLLRLAIADETAGKARASLLHRLRAKLDLLGGPRALPRTKNTPEPATVPRGWEWAPPVSVDDRETGQQEGPSVDDSDDDSTEIEAWAEQVTEGVEPLASGGESEIVAAIASALGVDDLRGPDLVEVARIVGEIGKVAAQMTNSGTIEALAKMTEELVTLNEIAAALDLDTPSPAKAILTEVRRLVACENERDALLNAIGADTVAEALGRVGRWKWEAAEYRGSRFDAQSAPETRHAHEEAERDGSEQGDYWVTVCDACETASCWYGELMCSASQNAGTKEMKASALIAKGVEHPDHFSRKKIERVCGCTPRAVDDAPLTVEDHIALATDLAQVQGRPGLAESLRWLVGLAPEASHQALILAAGERNEALRETKALRAALERAQVQLADLAQRQPKTIPATVIEAGGDAPAVLIHVPCDQATARAFARRLYRQGDVSVVMVKEG